MGFLVYVVQEKTMSANQTSMKPTQDSANKAIARTTQYMSHGASNAGSDVLRAL